MSSTKRRFGEERVESKDSGPDNVYYDVTISNDSFTDIKKAEYEETRGTEIISNTGDYYLTVARFKVPTTSIPLFKFETSNIVSPLWTTTMGSRVLQYQPISPLPAITLGSQVSGSGIGIAYVQSINVTLGRITLNTAATVTATNITLNFTISPYIVTMDYFGDTYSAQCAYPFYLTQFTPDDLGYIYNVQQMIDSVNGALFICFSILKAEHAGFPGTHAPYITLNLSTNLMTLHVDRTGAGGWYPNYNVPGLSARLLFNRILYQLFAGFEVVSVSIEQLEGVPNKDFMFLIKNNGNNAGSITLDPQGAGPYNTWEMRQETSSLFNFVHFESIVFLTGKVPVKGEYVNTLPNTEFTTIETKSSSSTTSQFKPILTDFEPPKTAAGFDRSPLQYNPAQFRYIDMTSSAKLNQFDVQIYWQDKNHNIYPLYLLPREFATIKFLFKKKSMSF